MDKELVNYFIEQTNLKFQKVEHKLEELTAFKWKVIGMSAFASMLVHLAVYMIAKG